MLIVLVKARRQPPAEVTRAVKGVEIQSTEERGGLVIAGATSRRH
jgi:hypothetical protein